MAATPGLGGITRALRHRDYRLYTAGASASFLGTWVYRTALGWFTWELTQSTTWLGIVVLVEVTPHLALVPFTGALTDRVGALRIAKLAQICATALMTVLTVLTALDLMKIEVLLAIVFINGFIMALHQPSYFALVASLVPREDLSAAVALQSSMVHSARFLGPALSGVLILRWGSEAAFAVNALSYVCLLTALLFIQSSDATPTEPSTKSLLGDVADGLRFVAGHLAIRTILIVTVLLSMMLRPVMEMMPGFASEVFGRGADGLAWLMSSAGGGAIMGSLWLARRGRTAGLTRIYALTTLAAAVALFAFAQAGSFWPGVALITMFGLLSNINSICSQILVQNAVDPAMRARVMSLVGLTFRAVPAMSVAVVGWLASMYGLAAPFSVVAALAFATGLWMFRLIRRANLAQLAEEPARR